LTKSESKNKFSHQEIYDVMDLCLSCKGCKSECPSNVDVAKLKAEFLYQYYKDHGIPWRSKVFGNITKINHMNSKMPRIANFMMSNSVISSFMKKIMGVAAQRKLPLLAIETVKKWAEHNPEQLKPSHPKGKVFLFNDEFTNYLDAEIGKKTIRVLVLLGYEVELVKHSESGRSFISKGMLAEAKEVAIKNVMLFSELISAETPLVGVEPSAILSFRDEYPDLVPAQLKEKAEKLSKNAFLVDEFIHSEMQKGKITSASFTSASKKVLLHGHCHQKAIGSVAKSKDILSLPKNYKVEIIPSGCCGMAGSFGYEKEHYDVSMQVGELVLFPAIRKSEENVLIAAPGTSCRHQIHDGTKRTALHPIEILYQALT
jgi:Fe-S oxidoreductase